MDSEVIHFFLSPVEDYVSDGLLLGLLDLVPSRIRLLDTGPRIPKRFDCRYDRLKLYGRGFGLYSKKIVDNIKVGEINDVNTTNGCRGILVMNHQCNLSQVINLICKNRFSKIILLDGCDSPRPFLFFRKSILFFIHIMRLKTIGRGSIHYCKRERTVFWGIIMFFLGLKLRRISISIPDEFLVKEPKSAKKLFVDYIVDLGVANKIGRRSNNYLFDDEDDYFSDLRESAFGITMKKAGWDCFRHYEQAASGCIPCFKNLHSKPWLSAPFFGGQNFVIGYRNAEELFDKISRLTMSEIDERRLASVSWARENTPQELARRFLKDMDI